MLHEPLSVRVALGMVIVLVGVGATRRRTPDAAGPAGPEPPLALATPGQVAADRTDTYRPGQCEGL